MSTIVVWSPQAPGRMEAQQIELSPGEEITFGRGEPGRPVDLPFPDAAVSRLAGRLRAVEDHWVISNLSAGSTYVVENPEGAGEFLKVAPRRMDMPVPFEFARVVLPAATGSVSFHVFAPQHTYVDLGAAGEAHDSQGTVQAFPLDESAKYFLVLVSLCEPVLRDSSSVVIPTAAEIVNRLAPLPSCRDLTVSAVHFHIDYLATRKLRVKERDGDAGGKRDWQRAALVALAVRFDLVREEHLSLLPPRRTAAQG